MSLHVVTSHLMWVCPGWMLVLLTCCQTNLYFSANHCSWSVAIRSDVGHLALGKSTLLWWYFLLSRGNISCQLTNLLADECVERVQTFSSEVLDRIHYCNWTGSWMILNRCFGGCKLLCALLQSTLSLCALQTTGHMRLSLLWYM